MNGLELVITVYGCLLEKMSAILWTVEGVREFSLMHWIFADVPFVLHLGDTTLTVPLSTEEGKNLSVKFNDLLKVFAAKQEAERPKRWEALEYKFEDSGTDAPISCLEIFCNPNMHSTAFDAKMLVTVKTPQGVNMMAEGSLSTIRADLQAFLGNTS